MESLLLLLSFLVVCLAATEAVGTTQPSWTSSSSNTNNRDRSLLNGENTTAAWDFPSTTFNGDDNNDMLEQLSQKLDDLNDLITALRTETTVNLPQDLQTGLQRLVVDGLQKELTQQLQLQFQSVDDLVQELMEGIEGLPTRLSSEAADLVVEIEGKAQSLVTMVAVVITLLLLMSLCCGCGCGGALIYLSTRRAEQIVSRYHRHHPPPQLVSSRLVPQEELDKLEAAYDVAFDKREDYFIDEDVSLRNDNAESEHS